MRSKYYPKRKKTEKDREKKQVKDIKTFLKKKNTKSEKRPGRVIQSFVIMKEKKPSILS